MRYIALCLLLLGNYGFAQTATEFKSLQEVLSLAEKNSYTARLSEAQRHLSKLTVQSAYGNAFNPKLPASASITDNASLPVNFLPAEAFGGPAGTFRQVTLGQRYISTLNISPQFDILHFGNIAKIKSAKANDLLTQSNNMVTKKNLFDQVNACYHNILSFQAQIDVLQANKSKSDSTLRIVKNKYDQGLVRKQDLNDAEINTITIADKLEQAKLGLEQQYLTLRVLCDTDAEMRVSQSLWDISAQTETQEATGDLSVKNAQLQASFAQAEFGAAKWQNMPTLSFVSSFNWQNNSNKQFFDPNQNKMWIYSNFWGLRLNWDIPTNVAKLTAQKSAQISYSMAKINAEHAVLQGKIQNEQIEKDYAKAVAQYNNYLQITKLKEENYQKSKNQFEANILPLDKLLLAHNDLLLSQINLATGLANVSFSKSKIEINNQIK
jgi:outer membrane protein TolC